MNSRHNIPLSELSRGQWPDEPPQPPEPRRHPTEPDLVARVRPSLGKLGSLTSSVRPWLEELDRLASSMWTWLSESDRLARTRSWLGEPNRFARVWSSLTALSPSTFARYLVAFFIGVVATVSWQSSGGGVKEKPLATPPATLAPAALDSMRQSVDKLAVEVTQIRAVEQDILERITASQQPVVTSARNPAHRSPSGH